MMRMQLTATFGEVKMKTMTFEELEKWLTIPTQRKCYKSICKCYAVDCSTYYEQDYYCEAPACRLIKGTEGEQYIPQEEMECDKCLHRAVTDYQDAKHFKRIKKVIKQYPEGYIHPVTGKRYSTKKAFRMVKDARRKN